MLRIISLRVPPSTHVSWQVPVSVDFVLTSSALGVVDLTQCPHEYGLSKEGAFEVCCVIVKLRASGERVHLRREESCIRGVLQRALLSEGRVHLRCRE